MQNEPEKTLGNYNEFLGVRAPSYPLHWGTLEAQIEKQETSEQREIIETGLRLVDSKIDEILGPDNKLTGGELALPDIEFIDTYDQRPDWAGYFNPYRNRMGVITGKVRDRLSQTKVFIHEYLHFLSHNGRDDNERVSDGTPIAQGNNVGFRRHFGIDIRKGKEGEDTSDYFLSFNEAVTEQLAIDIFPGAYETYDDYRGLLNQVMDDVTAQGLGSENESGAFQPWSKEQVKNYIYRCFFRGDLEGFTQLLQTTYKKFDLSEQQFGLMTHRDDLPSVIEDRLIHDRPDSPPPSPSQVAAMVQERLDRKTPDDYVTDVIGPEPGNGDHDGRVDYGARYDTHVSENGIVRSHRETINGKEYDIDSLGYIIFRGEEAASVFENIRAELDDLLAQADSGDIDAKLIAERMDQLLFDTYFTSMLSDGFRDFYIYKHVRIDAL